MPSPTPGIGGGLRAISATRGGTAWAAGFYCTGSCGTVAAELRTLVLRWNGFAWSEVPSASPGRTATLNDVQAGADDNAWAVGSSCVSSCGSTTSESDRMLILHWNGATWSQVTIPSSGSTFLTGMSITPGGTAWAVGRSCSQYCDTTSEADHTLILHWNKVAWSISPS